MKLWSKMLLSVVVVVSIIFFVSFYTLTTRLQRVTLNNAYSYIDATARENANSIRANIDNEMGMARSIAHSFHDLTNLKEADIKDITKRTIHGVAINNKNILAVWMSWELNAIRKGWNKPYGRDRQMYVWDEGNLNYVEDLGINADGDVVNSAYYKSKINKMEDFLDPYWETYKGSSEKIQETSICVPVLINGTFAGLFGFDFALDRYQTFIDSINPYGCSYAMLLSQNGTVVAHTDITIVGNNIDSLFSKVVTGAEIYQNMTNGKNHSITFTDDVGVEQYATFSAIQVGNTQSKWSLAIVTPKAVLIKEAEEAVQRTLTLIIVGIIVLAAIVWLISYSITHPLVNASRTLRVLAKGQIDINNKLNIKTGDEIEDIGKSVNTLIESLDKIAHFAKEIGRGNLNIPFQKLSDNDVLGESLLEMRKSLEQSKELDNRRKIEEDKERWANGGIAQFAELLRSNTNNMDEFAYSIISNITNYVGANIGGLFLLNTDKPNDKFFELKGCFAYESRKYAGRRIELGEGLVGRCAKEGETIILTELPKDYIKIATGLGFDDPNCLLLVPLKLSDEVFGVIEIASFDELEPHKIKFVEKIGESIASTISNVRINQRTAKLLEESRIKSEELSTQEEEMRQNMEELLATQEEAARKTIEMEGLINALNASSYIIEYDINGVITSVNSSYIMLTHQSESQLVGTHHADNILFTEEQKQNYPKFWSDLQDGQVKKETSRVTIDNVEYTFIETYSPIFDETRKVKKILKIAHNITDFVGKNDNEVKKQKKK